MFDGLKKWEDCSPSELGTWHVIVFVVFHLARAIVYCNGEI